MQAGLEPMNLAHLHLDGAPALHWRHASGATVTVLLRGAQVISWVDARGREGLYRSPLSPLAGVAPARAGIPVVFPQFGAAGPLPRHGLVRTGMWQFLEPAPGSRLTAPLRLSWQHRAHQTPDWPHACTCVLQVQLDADTLTVTLEVHNQGPQPLPFCAALHTYLRVPDTAQTQLWGLRPGLQPLSFDKALDQIHPDVPGAMCLHTPGHRVDIAQSGFCDAVAWNPGAHHGLGDLPAQGHREFVCVEAAQLTPVQLPPGATWSGRQSLRSVPTR